MKRALLTIFVVFGCMGSVAVRGQGAVQAPAPAATESALLAPPKPRTPIERFRELLAMPPQRRAQALAAEPADRRQNLQAKLAEYDLLPSAERETRLHATELRWYLMPLLQMPAGNRAAFLSAIPPVDRRLLEDRLREWDIMPPPLREALLKHETTLHYFTRLEATPAPQRDLVLAGLSPERRGKIEHDLAAWQKMSPDERQLIHASFQRFFELNPQEKQRVLQSLPAGESPAAERALAEFQKLSREQRQQCLDSVQKLGAMSDAERAGFLRGAGRWLALPDGERQVWRQLALQLPPLPPEHPSHEPPLPGAATGKMPLLPGVETKQ